MISMQREIADNKTLTITVDNPVDIDTVYITDFLCRGDFKQTPENFIEQMCQNVLGKDRRYSWTIIPKEKI